MKRHERIALSWIAVIAWIWIAFYAAYLFGLGDHVIHWWDYPFFFSVSLIEIFLVGNVIHQHTK